MYDVYAVLYRVYLATWRTGEADRWPGERLSRDTIVDGAIALADAEGLDNERAAASTS
jgi:hypothetical protein